MQTTFTVRTTGPGLYEFTEPVTGFVRASGSGEGLLTLFVQHTSCSLCIQENADPDVRRDLDEFYIRTIGDLGRNKYFRAASALADLADSAK